MPLVRVQPDDDDAVAALVSLLETARTVDDPDERPIQLEPFRRSLRFGWDLHPPDHFLLVPHDEPDPVAVLVVEVPVRDNLHLVWIDIVVTPARRRAGFGSQLMEEALRRTRELGRTTIWAGGPKDAPATAGFLEHHGFRYASHDARRRQRLAEVDHAELDRLHEQARAAAADYELTRLLPPEPEDLLVEIAEVAEAINDAPMGDLSFEREVIDLQRMRDVEAARVGREEQHYRVVARHRVTGQLAGHTLMVIRPWRPAWADQGDTAVARQHRGHRLGLLLKIEMLRWLAETQPQLEEIETWNQADNGYMIKVNEAMGYRLNRMFAMYERTL